MTQGYYFRSLHYTEDAIMCRINKSKKKKEKKLPFSFNKMPHHTPPHSIHNISLVTKSGKTDVSQKFKGIEGSQGDILESAVKVYKVVLISPGKYNCSLEL